MTPHRITLQMLHFHSVLELSRYPVQVFEHHKEQEALERAQAALAQWQAERDAQADLVNTAASYRGQQTTDGLMLKPGESLYATVTQASLVEERAGQGHFVSGSQGLSIPIGSLGGHAVRYRVGATRGHYIAAAPVATAIDTGTVYVTDQRVVFTGSKQTRECAYAKLLSTNFSVDGTCTLAVSNRQKPTVIHYGASVSGWFEFRLDLALAHYRGTVTQLAAQLQNELADLDAHKPPTPATPAS
jgi:hypothetical protein